MSNRHAYKNMSNSFKPKLTNITGRKETKKVKKHRQEKAS